MKKRPYIFLTAIALFAILLSAGCGTSASLVLGGLPTNDWPKKRVMLMPATDLTGIPLDGLMDTVRAELSKTLKKTGFFNVYHQDKTKKFRIFKPREPIDPELMREAKGTGMNAIIFETINPIETNLVKTGIWPFRRKVRRFTVSMNIDILDVNRGTILLSKEVADNITFSEEETKEEREKPTDVETKKRALEECLPDLLKQAAMAAILSLNGQMWIGTIVSADEKGIIVNAGRDAGLRPGIVCEVFGAGESITSFKGQAYHLPGPKVGKIKIVRIKPRHSLAKPVNGSAFKSGQIIRVKE